MHRLRGTLAALLLIAAWPTGAQAQPTDTWATLAPLLAERCVMCHNASAAAVGLRLDSLEGLKKGSTRGPVVQPGHPAGSEIVRRVKGSSLPRMPMTGPPWLPDADVARLERWISAGLPEGTPTAKPDAASTASAASTTATRPAPGQPVTWVHVAPLLATRCAQCHTDNGAMGPPPEGYRLTSYEATLSTADRVRVVPGQPGVSELLRRVQGHSRPRMPYNGPPWLSAEDTQLIADWIAQGARNAQGQPAPVPLGARVRLGGTVDAQGRLDGLPLHMAPGARLDKMPRAGEAAQVRGRVGEGGRVEVERVRGD
ncbi:c-type cytochrome domain-containing protein [Hydrogenophaga sp. IBVHS2]|uniref:c-type cytochrome domain-containing protein n=1 Tax=Hydrogenophaga sp. IBVHS2 TaxID=1985170 RepID=UPI002119D4CB|nr:c-type cytochrome domain-containing protein [Hydrogenophaga sp. IBVHS2]